MPDFKPLCALLMFVRDRFSFRGIKTRLFRHFYKLWNRDVQRMITIIGYLALKLWAPG